MTVVFDTLVCSVILLEIESVYSELLDEHGYGVVNLTLKDNEHKITKCEYEGYGIDDILTSLKEKGLIDINPKTWRVYKKFEAIVKYEDFKSLSEMVLLNNIISQSKTSNERDGIVNTTKAWNDLDIFNKEDREV